MAQKKKKEVRRLGKLPPQYRFFLNPYKDARFTRCPECDQPMKQRKLPLVIHIDPMELFSLNKTCRYCPHCDLLIVHKDILEHLLASIFDELKPEIVGNPYLVVGTMEKAVWKRGVQDPLTISEMLEALHDFKEAVTFQLVGGWGPKDAQLPAPK
jgi:hypothetical protein